MIKKLNLLSTIRRPNSLSSLFFSTNSQIIHPISYENSNSYNISPISIYTTLTPEFISSNYESVVGHYKARNCNEAIFDSLKNVKELFEELKAAKIPSEFAVIERKKINKELGILNKELAKNLEKKEEILLKIDELKKENEKFKEIINSTEVKVKHIEELLASNFSSLPNLLHPLVKYGKDENDNEVVFTWPNENKNIDENLMRKVGSNYKFHEEIGNKLGCLDLDVSNAMSGSRFNLLIGKLSRLERALSNFFLDEAIENNYKEISVPLIVNSEALYNTGQLPKFELDLFKIHDFKGYNDKDMYLIPTSEVPLTNIIKNRSYLSRNLPMYLTSLSPCFRSEIGSHGKDTKGLFRQHQFNKVELVKIIDPKTCEEELNSTLNNVKNLLEKLKLPFRIVRLCSGDIGISARICYDFEVWMPGQQRYREISSVSLCGDYQSNRMNSRFLDSANKNKLTYPHTINGSALAVGRSLVAILENYQNPDGSVDIPEVLVPYMGGIKRLEPQELEWLYSRDNTN